MTGTFEQAQWRPPGVLRSALSDAGAVLVTAARLLWRHWPVLVALYLAGEALKELAMRGAVKASALDGFVGLLVFVLVPMASLLTFILMLRSVRPSLPFLSAVGGARAGGLLNNLVSVLVPFLTVYISYGLLKEDGSDYSYRVWEDETLNNPDLFDNPANVNVEERLPFSFGITLVIVFTVAIALRWAANHFDAVRRHPWLSLPVGYVEACAAIVTGFFVVGVSEVGRGWIEDRRVVRWLYEGWYEAAGMLGPVADLLRGSVSWLWNLIADSANAVIVIPVAWLLVGAVVYGQRVTPVPTPASETYQRAAERWARVPTPVHRVAAKVSAEVRYFLADRMGTLAFGLRLLFRAGAVPILLFCLAFVVADGASAWLWELERLLIGPRDLNFFWAPFSSPLALLNRTVAWVLLACLLAAAVDRVLRDQAGEPPPVPTTREDTEPLPQLAAVSRA